MCRNSSVLKNTYNIGIVIILCKSAIGGQEMNRLLTCQMLNVKRIIEVVNLQFM